MKTITLYAKGYDPEKLVKKSDVQLQCEGKRIWITGLPDEDKLIYLLEETAQLKFYVAHQNPANGTLRLHIGLEGALMEAEVKGVVSLRSASTIVNYVLDNKKGHLRFYAFTNKYPEDTYNGKTESVFDLLKAYTIEN